MDPRKILGVSTTATPQEIQRAYRAKVKKHHPDLGGDARTFQQVQDAYKELTNSDLRKSPAPKPSAQARPNSPRQPKQPAPKPTAPKPSASKPSRNRTAGPTKHSRVPLKNPSLRTRFAREPYRSGSERTWKDVAFGQLPLQTETTWFILINCLDIFLTHMLLYAVEGATEVNPIANYFIQRWNYVGAIVFKLAIVAFVCVIAQIVTKMRPGTGKLLLNLGSAVVGCVVVYSVLLYMRHQ